MISPTIGGGVGRLQGLHGMISDQLLSVRMVIANGTVVTASQEENPDLFWAVRGAGANFGIVVEAEYQLTDLASEYVINMDYALSSNASSAIVDFVSSFGDDLPARLSFMIVALYSEDLFGDLGVGSSSKVDELNWKAVTNRALPAVWHHFQRNLQRAPRRSRGSDGAVLGHRDTH